MNEMLPVRFGVDPRCYHHRHAGYDAVDIRFETWNSSLRSYLAVPGRYGRLLRHDRKDFGRVSARFSRLFRLPVVRRLRWIVAAGHRQSRYGHHSGHGFRLRIQIR